MKNRLAYLFLGIFGLVGLASCESQLEDVPSVKTRTVFFSSVEKDAATRTGITIENKVVTPDWRKTKAANVHLFETGNDGGVSTGEDVEITVASDNLTASFKADFPAEWTIIVDPTEPTEEGTKGGGTKSVSNAPYTYSAVVAQKSGESFIVPSVQYPDAETLIDPDADFLIGYSKKSYGDPHDYTENVVDLYFDRPVVLSRITVTNFEAGEKVKSVTIKAQSGLTGSAAYNAIDFENANVTFTPGTESGTIELSYGNGIDIKADGTFEAYFVSLPGTVTITELAVATDKYNYVKTIEGGKDFTFSNDSFKTIKLDLTTATKEDATPVNTVWYKASVLEDGIEYLIVSQGYALKNNGHESVVTAQSVEVVDETISIDDTDGIVWTANANANADFAEYGAYTLSNGTEHLWRHSNNGTFTLEANSDAITKYMVWNYDGGYLWNTSIYTGSGSSTVSDYYAYYNSGWMISTTKTAATLYTTRAPQEIAFSESTVNYDVDAGEDFVEPTLEGAKTVVTYTSSNEAVATVDPSTGEVTIKKAGSATITATATGNAEYQAGTASYTIVATSGAIDTFYLASEIVAGESYMVVSGGKAMTVDGTTLGTVDVSDNDGIIQIAAADVALFEAAAHVEYYEGTSPAGHFTLMLGDEYLQRKSNKPAVGSIPSTVKYYVWEYDGEHLYHLSSSSTTFYVGYVSNAWDCIYQSPYPNTYLYTTTKQLQPQHISFSSESVTAVLGQPFTAPALSGVKTTVSYASSEESVATVASDGTVTLIGTGTTTITATAAASDEYNAGTASYTLKVTDGSVPTWYKAEEIEDGETYLIVSNGYAFENNGGSAAAIAVEVSDGIIVYDAPESVIFTATASSGKYTFKNDGKFLYRSSSSISLSSSSSTWSYDSENEYIMTAGSSSSYYLYYSTSQGNWSASTSSRTASVYCQTPPRATQELVFSLTSVEFDLAGTTTFTAPTLTGAQTAVTYSSSKAAVATVDAATGAVEIVGTGTTVITASAEGTAEYKPAVARYTLRVIDSSSPVTTKRYVLTSSIESGKNYIIVSGGYALKNDGGSVASVSVTPVGDALEFDPGEDEALAWTAESNSTIPEVGDYTFTNNSYRINRKSSSGSFSLTLVASSSSVDRYQLWLLKEYSGNSYIYHNSNSSQAAGYTYYIYYNSGWKISASTNSNPTSTEKPTQLFVEE